jgi:NAD(P)-dependent dehydrogenase (short-subunit alcohol dehydrogenase family)
MSIPVVLVTGVLTGIGRATAVAFAREGARAVVSRRNVLGTPLGMKHELRAMQGPESGSIIKLSSMMGHTGATGVPLKRAGEPEETAQAIAELASDKARFTGQIVSVDGGRSAA